jgi:hypothetical protein
MDFKDARKIIHGNGLVLEKMSDEEKAAKRKARRDAKRAAEKAEQEEYDRGHPSCKIDGYDDGSIKNFFKGLGVIADGHVPEFEVLKRTDSGNWLFKWRIEGRACRMIWDTKRLVKNKVLEADFTIDGEGGLIDGVCYRDPDRTPSGFLSTDPYSINFEPIRDSSSKFRVWIDRQAFIEFVQRQYQKLEDYVKRNAKLAEESNGDKIPESFKEVEFFFTEDPVSELNGNKIRVTRDRDKILKWFHEDYGSDNDSFKDFKEFLDGMYIEFDEYVGNKLFEIKHSEYNFMSKKGYKSYACSFKYDNEDVELKGWKLV